MKISKAVSTALLAVAAVGASAGSFAATDPMSGQTDLFVAVWNPTSNTSFVEDLGTTYSTLGSTFNNAGFSTSWNVDSGNLVSALGSGTYQYQVFAADYFTSTFNFTGSTAYLSLVAGAAIPTTIQNGDLVNNAIGPTGTIETYIHNNLPGTTTSVLGTGSSYWALAPAAPGVNDAFNINSLTNLGGTAQGNALNLIFYTAGAPDQASSAVTGVAVGSSSNRGVFNLSSTGLLTYNVAPSTVPLPAAGWLLISGLLGLVAVSRRRDAEAL
ncbi:MAG: VPLPA-CTERM sorting domain-containing protein [Gammaproteobacteria bacterium]|nr:VPLPA-CTERM sorting domain-containing protein [Gammaproteobacteria bacterium]